MLVVLYVQVERPNPALEILSPYVSKVLPIIMQHFGCIVPVLMVYD